MPTSTTRGDQTKATTGWMGTPGPWEAADVGDYSDFNGNSRVILGDDIRLAVVQRSRAVDPEADANAKGIAAVPQMIEALEQIRHSIRQARIPGNDWKRELALIENTVDAALASAGVIA